jgi:hypothetical protein
MDLPIACTLSESGDEYQRGIPPAPVIVNGMVFTNSGYGMWQGLPGIVLLAFGKWPSKPL